MSLLEQIAGRFRQREQAKAESYAALVARVLDSKAGDPEKVVSELERHGRTAEDLAAAVDRLGRRRAAAAKVRAARDLGARQDRAAQQIAAADAQLETAVAAARETHGGIVGPLQEKLRALERERREAEQASAFLVESYEGPAARELGTIAEEVQELTGRIAPLLASARQENLHATHFATQAAQIESGQSVGTPSKREYVDELRAKGAGHEERASAFAKEAAPLQERLTELRARQAELEAQLLEP